MAMEANTTAFQRMQSITSTTARPPTSDALGQWSEQMTNDKGLSKILVTYSTMSGSTVEVAHVVADRLGQDGTKVDIQPISQIMDFSSYDAVVFGAPIILGWHRDMVNFIVENQEALKDVPVAYFTTQLHLTKLPEAEVNGVPIFLDPKLAKPPANPDKMNISEKRGTPASCMGPALEKAPLVRPVGVGFFGGKLDYSTLKLLPKLFVKLIIRGVEGDYRNWDAIREWVNVIHPQLIKAR
jgi:menaquinone-dependent protoporphyrinogen IX oxidase